MPVFSLTSRRRATLAALADGCWRRPTSTGSTRLLTVDAARGARGSTARACSSGTASSRASRRSRSTRTGTCRYGGPTRRRPARALPARGRTARRDPRRRRDGVLVPLMARSGLVGMLRARAAAHRRQAPLRAAEARLVSRAGRARGPRPREPPLPEGADRSRSAWPRSAPWPGCWPTTSAGP